ncbi:unnamed protein product, partial [marine sediment metagenome]
MSVGKTGTRLMRVTLNVQNFQLEISFLILEYGRVDSSS